MTHIMRFILLIIILVRCYTKFSERKLSGESVLGRLFARLISENNYFTLIKYISEILFTEFRYSKEFLRYDITLENK